MLFFMSKISAYLLIIVATLSVALLGYHAYTLATTTLVFSTIWADQQKWSSLMVTVNKPWLASETYGGYLDTDAVKTAITKNGKKWDPTVSGEWYMVVTDASIQLSASSWSKWDQIMIDADIYNDTTSKKWELPRNIVLSYSDLPKWLEIMSVWLPRDLTYEATVYGYDDLDTSDIRWYIKSMDDKMTCSQVWWDPAIWKPLHTKTLETHTVSQKKVGTYTLDIGEYPSNACIIAGLSWDAQSLVFGPLETFTATGVVTDILSPEYDMQSRVEFRFNTDIFTDSGNLYSREYIDHRHTEKINFLKNSPSPQESI